MVATQRRTTTQRAQILAVLAGSDTFTSAQALHTDLRSRGSRIGLATVYRALTEMAAVGELDTVRSDNGEVLYRQCQDSHHHHHLVCRRCGKTVEVAAPGVERWAIAVATEHGFTALNHELELQGLCATCSAVGSAPCDGETTG